MCCYDESTFSPQLTSVRGARDWIADRLAGWQLGELVEDLRLVVSELVSNAILHARTAVHLVLSVGEGVVELAVGDDNPRTPRPRPQRADDAATGGRGLLLVDALSDEWGVAERIDGKSVWFRVAVPTDWADGARCVCGEPTGEARRTASGRRILPLPA